IDYSRIKADNPYKYKLYFEKVAKKIREYKILPHNTYNIDEKGFLIRILQKTKRIFTKSTNLNSANRGTS
ncbi:hypothetical protein EJ08DRAFT_719999, partial [Tothia fuscella]